MNGGYESLIWLHDREGHEYACSIDLFKGNVSPDHELTDEEKAKCLNVNLLIGTERW
ncbi:MAG: hypothetical protein ACOY32_01005 [Thermodesulfobacteriota bacterium]